MSAIKSSVLPVPFNTIFEYIARSQPNLTAREKTQRKFFSCEFRGKKNGHISWKKKSTLALRKTGAGRQVPGWRNPA